MLLGLVVIFVAALIHIIKAHTNGYRVLEWWENRHEPIRDLYDVIMIIFGLIIWPIRFTQFLLDIPWLYEQYELFEQCCEVESE